jgi:di/tricarboxylate transporter
MPFKTLLAAFLKDKLLLILLLALLVLSVIAPGKISTYPALVDWPTIAALTGLLVLTKGLEASGSLHRFGAWLLGLVATERSVALCMVIAAALLSTLLTNDVALFIVVPLTLGLCRMTGMSSTKLIVLEALAVNAGSALTPIGNPQNLFLWQQSSVSFTAFVLHMLPLVALAMTLLLITTVCMFDGRSISADSEERTHPLNRKLLALSLLLYLPFLVATDLHQASWAALVVLIVFAVVQARMLAQVDWPLLMVFILMFIDLRLIASLDWVHALAAGLNLQQSANLYFTGIAASQLISNVPAAIALAEYSKNWQTLAYGVNVGGFGLAIGSLANLIALRMAPERNAWLRFHLYAIPFLFITAATGYVLLSIGY